MNSSACQYLKILLCAVLFCLSTHSFANASQPGVWNAGGTVFTMLYPEDSLTFKKIQMVKEHIYIQLYKGYAVVKGVYHFRNTTDASVNFKMGYPINGIYNGGAVNLNQVTLDSLSQFKIKANNHWIPIIEQPQSDYGNVVSFSANWKVWDMAFAPKEIQTVEVYFIVNTNQAQVQKGYNSEQRNAFIYLLESGSVWKHPIEEGHFYIQLMDDLSPQNLKGISQGFNLKYNEVHKLFMGTKTQLSPTPEDNLVVTYHKYKPSFDFQAVILQADSLYVEIEILSHEVLDSLALTSFNIGNPYDVTSTFWGIVPALLTAFVMIAPVLIVIIAFLVSVWAVVKWLKIRRKRTLNNQ